MPDPAFVRAPWDTPRGVYSVLLVPPAIEPLTVDEAKLRAGLSWPPADPREGLMAEFIKAAREQVERDTGLALLTQTREVHVAAELPAGAPVPLPPQCTPVQSLVESGATVYRIVAGWPDAATLKAEAPLLVHAVGLLAAHYATFGRDLATTEGANVVPLGYADAIQPYRLEVLP
jgi:hypothetical protein